MFPQCITEACPALERLPRALLEGLCHCRGTRQGRPGQGKGGMHTAEGDTSSAHQEEPGSLQKGRQEVCSEGQTPSEALTRVGLAPLAEVIPGPGPCSEPGITCQPYKTSVPAGPEARSRWFSGGSSSVCLHGEPEEFEEEREAAGTCVGKWAWKKGPPQRLASLRGQNSAAGYYLTSQKCYLWLRRGVSSTFSTSAVSSQKSTVPQGRATYRCEAGSAGGWGVWGSTLEKGMPGWMR